MKKLNELIHVSYLLLGSQVKFRLNLVKQFSVCRLCMAQGVKNAMQNFLKDMEGKSALVANYQNLQLHSKAFFLAELRNLG